MKAYRLYTVVPRLVEFIEQLTNVYVRLNRNRLKGAEGAETARAGEGATFFFEALCSSEKLSSEVSEVACGEKRRFSMFPSPVVWWHGVKRFVAFPNRCGCTRCPFPPAFTA